MIFSVNPGMTPEVVAFGTVFAFPVYARVLNERRNRSMLSFTVRLSENLELKE